MIKNITTEHSRYVEFGINPTKKGYQKNIFLMAGDTETCDGKPLTIQFYDETGTERIIFVNRYDIFDKFLDYLRNIELKDGCRNIALFFHNLSFDLPVLMFKKRGEFAKRSSFNIAYKDVKLKVLCSQTWFCRINFYNDKTGSLSRRVFVIDTAMYFRKSQGVASLESIAKELNLSVKKMKKPDKLGEIRYSKKDLYFCEYALNDAVVEYHLAKWIINMHEEFDIPLSISIAQFAQRVFTKNFLKEKIPYPPQCVIKPSILAYHGGKNSFHLDRVCMIPDVYEFDVNSMYPYAMHQLPGLTKGYFQFVDRFDYEHIGIYCISGFIKDCEYPIIPDHNFKYLRGYIKNIWITCYELAEALKTGEFTPSRIFGYVWIPYPGAINPFKEYVEHFFNLKKITPKSDNRYMIYKLCLNSLYGKMIQNIDHDDKTIKYDVKYDKKGKPKDVRLIVREYRAGGLFSPFIASMITGFSRAMIHKIEHKYNALDTSTDSIKTTMKPDPGDFSGDLGKLSVKCFGDCLFFRNKLYVHFGKTISYALHGFEGSVGDLLRIYITQDTNYKYRHMVKIKESFVKDLDPFKFIEIDAQLKNIKF